MVAVNAHNDLWEGATLLVDKPLTWTSFDVVNKLRWALKTPGRKSRVGHAGTLDPLATGLLLICTGKHTKRIQELTGLDKTYTGTIALGATTPSYDRETEADATFDISGISEADILRTATRLTGELLQVPPAHSAIKVDGRRAYKSARQGKEVKLEPRAVTVHHFHITGIDLPDVHFEVRCSKGTYIRSLARDFGELLDNGAHLAALRRTAIGEFRVEDAWQVPDLVAHIEACKPAWLEKLADENR